MPQATFAECPKCGAKVRKEKLRRHVTNVHGEGAKAVKVGATVGTAAAVATVVFPWRLVAVLAAAGVIVGAGYWAVTQPAANPPPEPGSVIVLETNYGTIKIQLDLGRAPKTTAHMIGLVTAGKYDGNGFQRVAANFVIQAGRGADSAKIAWENTGLKNVRYSVAMARVPGDQDSASSEFFINLKDNPFLDGSGSEPPYAVFGHVFTDEGKAAVDAIGSLYPPSDPTYDGAPTSPVTISRAYME